MNIRELIEQLEDLATEYGDETEVRLATQPNYPFENNIGNITAAWNHEEDDDLASGDAPDQEPAVVYIGEGEQLGYLTSAAASELGWSRR